jgi:hypothetical protein
VASDSEKRSIDRHTALDAIWTLRLPPSSTNRFQYQCLPQILSISSMGRDDCAMERDKVSEKGDGDGDLCDPVAATCGPGSASLPAGPPELPVPPLRSVPSPGVGRNRGRFWARGSDLDGDELSSSSDGSDGGASEAESGRRRPPALCTLEAFVRRAVELGAP